MGGGGADGEASDVGDGEIGEADIEGFGGETTAETRGARGDGVGVVVFAAGFFEEFGFHEGGSAIGVESGGRADGAVAAAGETPAVGAVEGEQTRVEIVEGVAAVRAGASGIEDGGLPAGVEDADDPAAEGESVSDEIVERGERRGFCQGGDDDVDGMFFEAGEFGERAGGDEGTVDDEFGVALTEGGFGDLSVEALAAADDWGAETDRAGFEGGADGGDDGGVGLLFDLDVAFRAELVAGFGVEEPEEVIDFGDCGDGAFAAAAADALFDGDGGGEPADVVDFRAFHLFDELPGVSGHAIEEAALAFSEDDVEGEGAFAGAGETGDGDELVAGDFDRDVFEIVFAGAADGDARGRGGCGRGGRGRRFC